MISSQNTSILLVFSVLLYSLPLAAQRLENFVPQAVYQCPKTTVNINIDGDLEVAWKKAPWSDEFVDIEGDKKPKPYRKTQMKMLWDESYLYIAARMEEPDLWATLTKRDAIIYWDNDFEVFIDPDGDTHNYLEVEVNALNTIFDLMLIKPYRNGGPMVIAWDLKELKSAVKLEGSLNDPSDRDSAWVVEMAIPLRHLVFDKKKQFPKVGTKWNINFSRVHWDLEVVDGKYQKKKDPKTKRNLPEYNWVWSPQGLINMHYPEKWGILHFCDEKGTKQATDWEEEEIKWILRQLYYRQQEYYQKHEKYAKSLSELGLDPISINNKPQKISIESMRSDFLITLQDWQIRADSRIWKK